MKHEANTWYVPCSVNQSRIDMCLCESSKHSPRTKPGLKWKNFICLRRMRGIWKYYSLGYKFTFVGKLWRVSFQQEAPDIISVRPRLVCHFVVIPGRVVYTDHYTLRGNWDLRSGDLETSGGVQGLGKWWGLCKLLFIFYASSESLIHLSVKSSRGLVLMRQVVMNDTREIFMYYNEHGMGGVRWGGSKVSWMNKFAGFIYLMRRRVQVYK